MDEKQFVADLADFAEEYWYQFKSFAEERDYTESDCERMIEKVKAKAGRVS